VTWTETHVACPCGKSSDAFSINSEGWGTCFSCEKRFPPKGVTLEQKKDVLTTYEFLPWRGITAETMRTFNCKTKIETPLGGEPTPVSLGFWYSDAMTKVRLLDKKVFYVHGKAHPGLYGRVVFDKAPKVKGIIVTEGELDAKSAFQMTGLPSVSVQSASSAIRDIKHDFDWLNSFSRIYLCFDADEPGQEALKKVAPMFDFKKVFKVGMG
jgi:twinkle protein